MSFWSQLCLLIGKHITLRKRQPVTLLVELIWPILLLLIVSFIKQASKPHFKGPCYYKPITLPNGDFISFTRSFVCSMDYKCYANSRVKEAAIENNLAPLYDIVTSESAYAKLVDILPVLKSSLKDVNNLKNNPIFTKIENGSITITDFLNDTESFKSKLVNYGLSNSTSTTFLNSEIKILEIYKELKFTDKLKEKELCDPYELMKYLATNNSSIYSKRSEQELDKNQLKTQSSYQISNIICSLSKRKVLSDADFIFKEINVDIIANYTNSIVGFFENSRLNQTIEYLAKYLTAGKDFSKDFAIFEKFTNIEEIIQTVENGIKLLDMLRKYDPSIRFVKQVMSDFSPIFSTIATWNQFEALIDLTIGINEVTGKLESAFTVESVFGRSLLKVFESDLNVQITETYKFQAATLNLQDLLEFLLKIKFSNPHNAICKDPKITGIFSNNNYTWSNVVKTRASLDNFCSKDVEPYVQSTKIADYLYENLNFKYLFQTMTKTFESSETNFMSLFSKLENMKLNQINLGSKNDLTQIFGIVKTTIELLQEGLSDKGVFNTKNLYELGKRFLKLFVPNAINDQTWMYLDIFLPMFLPSLNTKNQFQPVTLPPLKTKANTVTSITKLQTNSITAATVVKNNLTTTTKEIISNENSPSSVTTKTTNAPVKLTTDFVSNNEPTYFEVSETTSTSEPTEPYSTEETTTSTTAAATENYDYDEITEIRETTETTEYIERELTTQEITEAFMNFVTDVTSTSAPDATYIAPRRQPLRKTRAFDVSSLAALGGLASFGLGGLGGGNLNSPQSILSLTGNLVPLLNLLPFDQLIPGSNSQDTSTIIQTIPLILSLVNSITSFNLRTDNSTAALIEWKKIINDFKSKSVDLVRILKQAGRIKDNDAIIIETVLQSADLDKITSPNAVGQIAIACQAFNIWFFIQPEETLKRSLKSVTLLMDIADNVLNTTLQLVSNDNVTFNCTKDPFSDYYRLTKNLNLLSTAAKIKELIVNQNNSNLFSGMECMKIDKIYDSYMKLQRELDFDTTSILKTKLKCFEESILNPLDSFNENIMGFLSTGDTNAETITLLTGNFNKLIDLVKLISWFSKVFKIANENQPLINLSSISSSSSSSSNILNNSTQIAFVLSTIPNLMKDLNKIRSSFMNMNNIQNILNISSIEDLSNEAVLFSLIDTIKSFKGDINAASEQIKEFLKTYDQLIQMTTYSTLLYDIQKGIESLADLVNFFSENINGVPVNKLFNNYTKISNYLQEAHGLSIENATAIGDAKVYDSPQKVYNSYTNIRTIICSESKLNNFLTNTSAKYVQIPNKNNNNLWSEASRFLCGINTRKFTDLTTTFANDFILPTNIREIFRNDTSYLMNLSKNNTLFTSFLDNSLLVSLNSSSLQNVRSLIDSFTNIYLNNKVLGIHNVFGKALCGNDFYFQIDEYFQVKSSPGEQEFIILDENDTRFNLSGSKPSEEYEFDHVGYCKNLTSKIRDFGGSVIENILKPIVTGKILYTPKTNVTTQIIAKINKTFEQFNQLVSLMQSFSNGLKHFDELRVLTQNLTILFENPFYQDFIQLFLLQQTQVNFEDVRNFITTLYNITSLNDNWMSLSSLLKSASRMMSCFETNRFVALDTEAELEDVAAKLFENGTFLAGIVFENVKYTDRKVNENIKVKIRMNIDNVPETNLVRPWLWTSTPADNLFMDLRYLRGFIQLQNLFERALIETIQDLKGTSTNFTTFQKPPIPVAYLQQFPYPKYKSEDTTASYVNYFILPILVTLMWSGNIGLAIRNLVKEKEKFIEETMKAMGLRGGINWLAWFMSTYTIMLMVSLFVSLILKYGGIFPITDLSIIFVALSIFGFSAIMLSFFVGSFFSKTNLASLIGVLVYFISYLPFILVMSLKYEISFASKFALCLSSATAFGYSSLYISWYEQQEKGLSWNKLWESPIPGDTMSFALTILIMIFDGVIYGLLGWYVKNVFPSRYGATKPWYFVFAPKFWRQTMCSFFCDNQKKTTDEYLKDRSFRGDRKGAKSKDKYLESEPFHLPVGISLKGLTRKFKDKTAVDNLSLNFFEGQITALLGHNGAGKSTAINVLTGIYTPTSGTAYIYNRDVRYEYNQIRKHVGICPQHDILFEYMTVKEHLLFYGKLKENMGSRELKRDINDMILKMGLNPYANDYVSCLSGGVRRRLEVAIAFVAGSKTVILDEPTNGVDPYNRMKIWDIILEFRVGRTILLTTHYLEEADILSDRIAIIHQGKLQCCGSSMFLKNRFGHGYILNIDQKKQSVVQATANISLRQLQIQSNLKSIESITQFINKRINGSHLKRSVNGQLSFVLAYNQKPKFEEFFNDLEQNKNILGVESYGISDTTLEEIFLFLTTRDENGDLIPPSIGMKLADAVSTEPVLTNTMTSIAFESDKDSGVAIESASQDALSTKSGSPNHQSVLKTPSEANLKSMGKNIVNDTLLNFSSASSTHTRETFAVTPSSLKLKGRELFMQQFSALLLQRLHHYRRNLRVLLTNVFLPCLFVALSMGFTVIRPKLTKQMSLEMSPEIYQPNELFMSFDKTNNTYMNAFKNDFLQVFNSTCPSLQQNQVSSMVNQRVPFSNQQQLNYLCNMISFGTCELVYQFPFKKQYTEDAIKGSLSIFLDSQNCTIEQILLDTHNTYITNRYGGYSYADTYIRDDMLDGTSKFVVWFQNQAFHAMPSYLHNFYSMYLQCLTESSSGKCNMIEKLNKGTNIQSGYEIYNHPISLNDDRISYDSLIQKIADIGISLTILCAYAFVPAGFIVYIVRERLSQEKRLKYVCGVRPFLYWLSAFVWDFAYYLVIIGLTLAVIGSFGMSAYTANSRNFGALVLLLIMFGWSTLPMSYMLGNFFKDSGTAYMIIFCFTLFSGIATCVTVFLLSFMADSNSSIKTAYEILSKISLLFPSYNLGSGLIELTKNQIMSDTFAKFGRNNVYKDPFDMEMLGYKYLALAFTGVAFFGIIALFESKVKIFRCCKPEIEAVVASHLEDQDVSQERQRIQNNEARSDILVVKNLTKRFRKATGTRVCAVNNLCFSIPWGHCFGLLGINGAGKTTTFKMITGDITPTFGTRLYNGMTMREFLKENIIGYCPQFDAVDEYLTGKEALYCYAKLIGLKDIHTAVLTAINRFKLQSYINIPILKYSGGMKRTLSVAVSMLGNPQVVFLDEPTNAMDPEMRRRVWDNILKLIKDDRSVLLTSHSMAECDVLCSRLAIMVNGQFMCLGTTQHLKHRFGGGYTLQIKALRDVALSQIIEFIETKFSNSILKDKHGNKLEFIIPHRGNSLGKIFGILEASKDKLCITDYSVSQTTLDQVFINFAKSQRDVDANDEEDEEENELENEKLEDIKEIPHDVKSSGEEFKFNTEITMINRKLSSKKSSLRKTSNCSHISKISMRRNSHNSNNSNSSSENASSESGCVNLGFNVEPPTMYSNNESNLKNLNNLNISDITIDSVQKMDNQPNENEYEYYSKC